MTARRRAPGKPPAELRLRDGSVRVTHLRAAEEAALYSELVHAGQPGLVELVTARRLGDGSLRMRSRRDPSGYLEAGDARALAAGLLQARRRREEAFTSPLARPEPVPGKRAVERGQIVWVDIDDPALGRCLPFEGDDRLAVRGGRERALRGARAAPDLHVDDGGVLPARRGGARDHPAVRLALLRPALVVSSGRGAHAYWRLDRELDGEAVESLNRRLAHHLGGDLACTDRGRVMRLPGSFNGKRGRWCAIRRGDLTAPPLPVDGVFAELPDPEPPRPPRARSFVARPDDELAAIAPPRYFALLCGADVADGGGYVRCPLHEERTASCMVWPDERGWWCFGCARGGGIYDLGSLLVGGPWGRDLKGHSFRTVRDALRTRLSTPNAHL